MFSFATENRQLSNNPHLAAAPGLKKKGQGPRQSEIFSRAQAACPEQATQSSWRKAGLMLGLAISATGALAGCNSSEPPPRKVETSTTQTVEEKKPHFSEGRTLLVDMRERATNPEFLPDPAHSVEQRGQFPVYEQAYIDTLVNRDLTAAELPAGAPRFTSMGADDSQMSKLYFGSDMEEVGFGNPAIRRQDIRTRPHRRPGQGAGITDGVTQHHLSCIYRLEEDAVINGVELEGGKLYRVLMMDPSNYTVKEMDKAVCPSNRLVRPENAATQWDIEVIQTNDQGETLYANPADILQVWTLTESEAARYGAN